MCANGALSSWQAVISGIPQGSVMGATLFVICINDMPDVVEGMIKLFAEDTKVSRVIQETVDCEALQRDFNRLQD